MASSLHCSPLRRWAILPTSARGECVKLFRNLGFVAHAASYAAMRASARLIHTRAAGTANRISFAPLLTQPLSRGDQFPPPLHEATTTVAANQTSAR